MKRNNWKYWISWEIKHGVIGKLLLEHFSYAFSLSKEEILYKYPKMEKEYIEKIKNEFGEETEIEFKYSKGKHNTEVDIFYIKERIKKQYCSFCPIPNIFFNKKRPTKKNMEDIRKLYYKNKST